MKYLVDTHFHLDQYRNYMDISNRISTMAQYTICVTNSPGVFLSCKNMIPETKYLRFAIGYHPQDSTLTLSDLKDFFLLLDRTKYVGEVGLDFSRSSYMDRDQQIDAFDKIVRKCAADNKVLTVHSKGAERQVLEIVKRYSPKKCIIHWYTGSEDILHKLLNEGCYFSVNSNMINSRSSKKYLMIPKNKLLVESDGPHTKVNGQKYMPEMLVESYRNMAYFFNDPDFVMTVYNNFKELLTAR